MRTFTTSIRAERHNWGGGDAGKASNPEVHLEIERQDEAFTSEIKPRIPLPILSAELEFNFRLHHGGGPCLSISKSSSVVGPRRWLTPLAMRFLVPREVISITSREVVVKPAVATSEVEL
ncbi:hypothetical protein CRG98_040440 [Punica granatum]|uniref:Uncharacterized protein n=1 Tax=Punica granatum TaxID=22663 RepID=A0A2I0I5C3_PUNGR|nr:hypothetical protein CRG98_040440 [Punica granatum]